MTAVRTGVVDAMFGIVADHGLDRLSVREVAGRAGVSIGAVQHHFPAKDAMLAAAFGELVARTWRRVDAIELGPDTRANLRAVLSQVLPLDADRAAEARVHLAFAARAAVNPELAEVQKRTLAGIVSEMTVALHGLDAVAAVLLAAVDGLAAHAISVPGPVDTCRLNADLDILLDAFVPAGTDGPGDRQLQARQRARRPQPPAQPHLDQTRGLPAR